MIQLPEKAQLDYFNKLHQFLAKSENTGNGVLVKYKFNRVIKINSTDLYLDVNVVYEKSAVTYNIKLNNLSEENTFDLNFLIEDFNNFNKIAQRKQEILNKLTEEERKILGV